MNCKVIDNFLDNDTFSSIQSEIYGITFPWFQNDHVVSPNMDNTDTWAWQLTHVFYLAASPQSRCFPTLEPILKKLNPAAILRIKANLVPRADKIMEHGFHIDVTHFKGKTAVYYINSNNGFTVFEDGSKVESIANRMVIFDSTVKHTGTTCTDARNRCVINFNYYEWDFDHLSKFGADYPSHY
jgi:hypothetical protein